MKKIVIYLSLVVLALATISCEQQFIAEIPEILRFDYEPVPAVAGTFTKFNIEAQADMAVLWYGTATSDYDAYLTSPTVGNAGVPLVLVHDKINDIYSTSKSFNYPAAGNYKAVLVVTNVGDLGETLEQVTQTIEFTVQEPAPGK